MGVAGLILQILEVASGSLAGLSTNGTVNEVAQISAAIEKLVAAALQAHQDIVGQPIDLTKLQPIDKVQ